MKGLYDEKVDPLELSSTDNLLLFTSGGVGMLIRKDGKRPVAFLLSSSSLSEAAACGLNKGFV